LCVATPGNGNDAIARNVIKHLDDTVSLVMVNWSYPGRFEFHWHDWGWQNFKTEFQHVVLNQTVSNLRTHFFADITLEYIYYKYFQEIIFLQQYLKNRNIPYIFSTAKYDTMDQKTVYQFGQECINLWNAIDFDCWHFWETNNQQAGFIEWARHHRLPFGKHGHPLEESHKLTFEMVKNKI
jgi:hypothetical protein